MKLDNSNDLKEMENDISEEEDISWLVLWLIIEIAVIVGFIAYDIVSVPPSKISYCYRAWNCDCNGETCECIYCVDEDDEECAETHQIICPDSTGYKEE